MPKFTINWGPKEEIAQDVAWAILVFVLLFTILFALIGCYCGRENEYTEIKDLDDSDVPQPNSKGDRKDVENGEIDDSLAEHMVDDFDGGLYKSPPKAKPTASEKARSSTPARGSYVMPRTTPTPAELNAAEKLVQEIDYYVRHMEDFYATGFYCSVVVLENQLNLAEKWRIRSLRDFIRKRPEFKMRSNMSAFKLTNLTPFREYDVQVSGKFQCVNIMCRHYWESLCTFADHFQKCPLCHSRVYPFEQNVLHEHEVSEFMKRPEDKNFIDQGEIAFACRRDAVEIMNSPSYTPARN
eukprot:CAMPEP_0174970990 /NCGR_PEP_ID=MMETSP0004_2-20121128/9728_1 /TAXON_ID=420556 /ORGANISM="Ochromonas sp., Strain CCMP1393" /LENGTH=296 /DNA_ID=CAMNT_0016220859 /DNA_START=26 /DNA_END=916 /DNA_ORIENTATION=+